jgi:hypothetical protein
VAASEWIFGTLPPGDARDGAIYFLVEKKRKPSLLIGF